MGPYNVRGLVAVLSLFLVSCGTSTAPSEKSTAQVATRSLEAPAKPQLAVVGQPAPDFSLDDLDGVPFQLSGQLGKTVVLEWFNPDCPFVALAHERVESLKGLYFGRALSFMNKTWDWSTEKAEEEILAQAEVFRARRDYLIEKLER